MKPPRHQRIPPLQKDEHGNPLCRHCQQPVPKPRKTFCSQRCVDEALVRSNPGWARTFLQKRDNGICAACGCDATAELRARQQAHKGATRLAEHLYHAARRDLDWVNGRWQFRPFTYTPQQTLQMRRALIARLAPPNPGWTLDRTTGWDADHITPVEHGGGSCDLDNLQTLCHPCHKRKTAQQAAEKAQARKKPQAKPTTTQTELPI